MIHLSFLLQSPKNLVHFQKHKKNLYIPEGLEKLLEHQFLSDPDNCYDWSEEFDHLEGLITF